ncbi:ABC transporter ATP-binding protein [Paenibacillus xylaniclasticus]|uniref:ABC transporter ATP-binding protein n=1 Tax=Paenibacillus xylaniclasticus TaxID=588083 RepID=UPI000FDCB518|nr:MULTISPECIES: ABC transporter ATP-binding protein [Paenibacillus]GFN29776.1 putative multidrug export ATP-binding/permease protein YgaD [Paenibacillus curdlanolyticus]
MNHFRQFMPYVRQQKKLYLLGFAGSLFRFLIPLSVPLVIKYLFDHLLRDDQLSRADQTGRLLLIAAVMIAVFFVVRAPMEYVRQYGMNKANNRVMTALRRDTFAKVHALDAKYLTEHRSGEIGTRFFDDIEKVRGYMTAMFSNIWIEMIVLMCVIGIMLTLNVTLTVVGVLLVSLQFLLAHALSRKVKATTRSMMSYRSVLSGFVLERIQGALWSKLYQSERQESKQLDRHLEQYGQIADRQAGTQAVSLAAVNVLSDITPFLVVSVGCLFVIYGELTLGSLIAFFAYVDRMRGPVAALVQAIPVIAEGSVALGRIFEFMKVPTTIIEQEGAKELERFEDAIVFDRVSFSYDGKNNVLSGVSLRLERGKTYAFVGESGGGKSTIMQLLSRMYDVTGGQVTIDGDDLRNYSLASIRKQMGVVTQDNFLYSTSIADNIRLAKPDATDEEVIAAARKAFAHHFITALPSGYDTEVGERGVKLSGGQKQRIALARMFLKDPAIVLLDEATSALDNESEKFVQASIDRMRGDKTIVMIAHRLSTVIHADRIFVLRNGRIAEAGTHRELLQAGGFYKQLYDKQSLGSRSGVAERSVLLSS